MFNKKSSFIALVALFVAALGVVIGLTAYFKNRNDYLYDDDDDDFLFDDPDDLEYYSSDLDSESSQAESEENADGDLKF